MIQNIFCLNPLLELCMLDNIAPKISNLIWKCNLKKSDVAKVLQAESLWSQTLETWCEINYFWAQNRSQVEAQIIWLNSEIRIKNTLIFWPRWYENRIINVSDIVDRNGEFIKWENLPQEPNKLNWLEWTLLTQSIPPMWKVWLKNSIFGETRKSLYEEYCNKGKITRMVYDQSIEDYHALLKYANTWREDGWIVDYETYRKSFKEIYMLTRITKLRDFQYRLLMNKLVTKTHLYK